ncbi:MAG TPA: glycosyltransferase [Polyangiales bacterium]
MTNQPSDAFLFEVAWEVCNQVGGIYQVLRSKAPLMTERWRDQYCLIGPYIEGKAQLEFEPAPAPGWLGRVVDTLQSEGFTVRYGRWLIPAKPRVLLVDFTLSPQDMARAKYRLWEDHRIESPPSDLVIERAIGFADSVNRVLQAVQAELTYSMVRASQTPTRVVAQFHEWQGGLAIPLLRRAELPIATVFTTHATTLGRYIASNEPGFYDRLRWIDHAEAAQRYNVVAQHGIERACTHGAHVFTTVSQITAEECTTLLGRTPDVITPNGLSIARYNVGHDFQTFHADFKERIHAFTMGHFFPSYSFDLDRTLYVMTSGRFEPHNKGFDLCLETMARLNLELKAARSDLTVVFFIVTSRPTRSIHPLVLEKRGVLNELRQVTHRITEQVGDRLFRTAASGATQRLDDLVDEYWMLRFRRTQAAFKANALPPVITHILEDDANDPVLAHLRKLGLFNRQDDPVKIVYHPEFIGPANPLWGIEYDQFVRGCHLGLFPSAYEPWGYTPLECMALGTPSISSDLAGFGRYVREQHPELESKGVQVLERRGKSFHEAAADLTRRLLAFTKLTRRHRVEMRNEVERRSWDFDWSRLGTAYHQAHELALERS